VTPREDEEPTVPKDPQRERLLRRGFQLEIVTIAWNVIEGVVAVAAGSVAGSVALIGFGIDSFVETTSAVVVGWRLRAEIRGQSLEDAEAVERNASRAAGALLLLLALYITVDAGRRLLGMGAEAGPSPVGIGLTMLSLAVMPFLGRAKLAVARKLGSGALRADAFETIACAWLSLTTLSGLVLNALLGWWWADPAAALVLVPLIVREGLEGLRGEEDEA
jgi:divalent metal cation (Fe/Co/Zn/Cd) transporter